jgi:hypothetical protein
LPPYPEENGRPGNITASNADDNGTHIKIYAVFTRSYIVQAGINGGASSGNGGTKRIVEIVVPVVVVVVVLILCLGIRFRWWKTLQKELETQPGIPELGEGLRHEIEGRLLGVTVYKEADIKASELESNTPLRESKNEKGGVELDSIDIREMGANVPAAHELGAKDEILSDKSLRMAEPM